MPSVSASPALDPRLYSEPEIKQAIDMFDA